MLRLRHGINLVLLAALAFAAAKAASTQRTPTPMAAMRYPMPKNEYLPPPPPLTSHRQFVGESRPAAAAPSSTTYQQFSSYVPPPSGTASFHYSMPKASQLIPLPSLLPKSVLPSVAMSGLGAPQIAAANPSGSRPRLMIEEPTRTYLTAEENRTLAAARLLADTVLGDNNNNSNNNEVEPPRAMNDTDIVIVKAQKNAYLVPPAAGAGQPMHSPSPDNGARLQELYDKREQLPKAFTINQFIFIIKPEKINFLNKLV